MSQSIFPLLITDTFIPSLWRLPTDALTREYADLNYVKFPIAQGSETFPANLSVSGTTNLGETNLQTKNSAQNSNHYLNFSDSPSTGVGAIQKSANFVVNPSTGTFSASGLITANGGLTTGSGQVLTSTGTTTLTGATTATGLITANGEIRLDTSPTIRFGPLSASTGFITSGVNTPGTFDIINQVTGGSSIIRLGTNNSLTTGLSINNTGLVTTSAGITATGLITANGGLTTGSGQVLTSTGTTTLTGATTATGLITANGEIRLDTSPTIRFGPLSASTGFITSGVNTPGTFDIINQVTGGSSIIRLGTNNSLTTGLSINNTGLVTTSAGITATGLITTSDLRINNSKIHIGTDAGLTNQGASSIAIGENAGTTNQSANSIQINATGTTISQATASTCIIAPIRQTSQVSTHITLPLLYSNTSNEVFMNTRENINVTTGNTPNNSYYNTFLFIGIANSTPGIINIPTAVTGFPATITIWNNSVVSHTITSAGGNIVKGYGTSSTAYTLNSLSSVILQTTGSIWYVVSNSGGNPVFNTLNADYIIPTYTTPSFPVGSIGDTYTYAFSSAGFNSTSTTMFTASSLPVGSYMFSLNANNFSTTTATRNDLQVSVNTGITLVNSMLTENNGTTGGKLAITGTQIIRVTSTTNTYTVILNNVVNPSGSITSGTSVVVRIA